MYKTVNAADINECAKVCNPAYDTGHTISDLEVFPDSLLGFLCFLAEHCLAGADDALTLGVDLKDLDLHGLANILAEICNILVCNL